MTTEKEVREPEAEPAEETKLHPASEGTHVWESLNYFGLSAMPSEEVKIHVSEIKVGEQVTRFGEQAIELRVKKIEPDGKEVTLDGEAITIDEAGNIVLPGNLIIVERRSPGRVDRDTVPILDPAGGTSPTAPTMDDPEAESGMRPLGIDMSTSDPDPNPGDGSNPEHELVPPVTICPCDVTIESDP